MNVADTDPFYVPLFIPLALSFGWSPDDVKVSGRADRVLAHLCSSPALPFFHINVTSPNALLPETRIDASARAYPPPLSSTLYKQNTHQRTRTPTQRGEEDETEQLDEVRTTTNRYDFMAVILTKFDFVVDAEADSKVCVLAVLALTHTIREQQDEDQFQ